MCRSLINFTRREFEWSQFYVLCLCIIVGIQAALSNQFVAVDFYQLSVSVRVCVVCVRQNWWDVFLTMIIKWKIKSQKRICRLWQISSIRHNRKIVRQWKEVRRNMCGSALMGCVAVAPQRTKQGELEKCSLLIFNSIWSHKSGFRLSTHKLSESHSNVKNIWECVSSRHTHNWHTAHTHTDRRRQTAMSRGHIQIYIYRQSFSTFRAIS